LPASTQWELIEAASETPQVIYEVLIGLAAQGRLLHNDDTHTCLLQLNNDKVFFFDYHPTNESKFKRPDP